MSETALNVKDTASLETMAEPNGILVIDKPEGITSFGVVAKIKKRFGLRKVGHCGTLDPFATGVLIVCLNQATRIVDHLLMQDKAYRFTIRFGVETDTLDRTGVETFRYKGEAASREELEEAVNGYRGSFIQKVPRFAAVKIQGRRLYDLVRKGVDVDPPSRKVHVPRLELLEYDWPWAVLEAHCSKGTYIRQLASDIGGKLRCGAHVSELRRLSSGPFGLEDAWPFEEMAGASIDALHRRLIGMGEALTHLPAVGIDDEGILKRLYAGCLDAEWEALQRERLLGCTEPVRIVDREGRLAALWRPHTECERRLRVFLP
ncbi:MAG: tRNA pseudouridine(55) synthase TruB [Acidobacteriota bacterium]